MRLQSNSSRLWGNKMKHRIPNEELGYIPQATYEQIVKIMPIVSVEALIVAEGKLLFLRRNNAPAKGVSRRQN